MVFSHMVVCIPAIFTWQPQPPRLDLPRLSSSRRADSKALTLPEP